MKWGNITHKHDGLLVSVTAKSTPDSPELGEGPYEGRIKCRTAGVIPVLVDRRRLNKIHAFVDWWDVELI